MTTTNNRQTVRELVPAIGTEVLVRFEDLRIRCTVIDAKNSWGKVRLLIAPTTGLGEQWIELGRLVATVEETNVAATEHHVACDSRRAGSADRLPCNCQEVR